MCRRISLCPERRAPCAVTKRDSARRRKKLNFRPLHAPERRAPNDESRRIRKQRTENGAECRLTTPVLRKYEREMPERNIAQGDAAPKSTDVSDRNYPLQHWRSV